MDASPARVSRWKIPALGFRTRLALALLIEIVYMILSRRVYAQRNFHISFAVIEAERTPLRFVTAAIQWVLMRDVLRTRKPYFRNLKQPAFIIGVMLMFAAPFLVASHDGIPLEMAIVALTSIPVAIHEELFFRGILLNVLAKRLDTGIALTVSAAAFAAFHIGVLPGTAYNVIDVIVGGFALGAIYLGTGSILLVMIIHAVYDMLPSMPGLFPRADESVGIGLLIMAALVLVHWWRQPNERPPL